MPSHPYASGGHNYYAAAFPTMPAAAAGPQPHLATAWGQSLHSTAHGSFGKDHLHYYGQVSIAHVPFKRRPVPKTIVCILPCH